MDAFRKIYPGEYYKKFLAHGVRPDDRSLLSIRKTNISLGMHPCIIDSFFSFVVCSIPLPFAAHLAVLPRICSLKRNAIFRTFILSSIALLVLTSTLLLCSIGGTTSAYGSSFVKVGNTTILCGIRAEVGLVPFPNDPTNAFDRRHLVVNLEMLPLCSPNIRSGKPIERAQIVGQKLNDLCHKLLDPSNLYSASELSHSNGQLAAWYLYADMYCFDHDGNIQDCAALALVSALKSTLLPIITVTPAGEACISSEMVDRTIALQLTHMPLYTTFGIIDEHILADPNLEEEGILSGTLTIAYDENGNLCSLECAGGATISDEQMKECMKLAKARVVSVAGYVDMTVENYFKKLKEAFDPSQ